MKFKRELTPMEVKNGMKTSFIFHSFLSNPLRDLTHEQVGRLLFALIDYQDAKEVEVESDILRDFRYFKNQMDEDNKKYDNMRQIDSDKGKKGSQIRWYNETDDKTPVTGAKSKKRKASIPPTIEEVKEYIKEKGFNVDANTFIDYYNSKNWRIGENKMSDWKAAVRTWEHREKDRPNPNVGVIIQPDKVDYENMKSGW